MVEWFNERYISRDEHQKVVDYYKKLVVQLHCSITDLRKQADVPAVDAMAAAGQATPVQAFQTPRQDGHGHNVISFDFRRRR